MSSEFASGRYAFGFCDRCGHRYDLNDLKAEFEDKKPNGLKVCNTCLDPDHPQLQEGLEFMIHRRSEILDRIKAKLKVNLFLVGDL